MINTDMIGGEAKKYQKTPPKPSNFKTKIANWELLNIWAGKAGTYLSF